MQVKIRRQRRGRDEALPVMTLELEDINYPAVMFEMEERLVVKAGAFAVHSSLDAIRTSVKEITDSLQKS